VIGYVSAEIRHRACTASSWFGMMQIGRVGALFLAAWILSMTALPIVRWTLGDAIIPAAATVSASLQAAAVALLLASMWGWRRSVVTIVVVAALTWAAEWAGSTTGLLFGPYRYTVALQPQLAGVPLLIPLAWLMMLGPSWAVAQSVLGSAGGKPRDRVLAAAVTGLAMAAWDLYLDPQMVGWQFWAWDESGQYFGIPLQNFVGWFIVAALVTLAVRPRRLHVGPLLLVYGVVWIFQFVGLAIFWGQPGPALFGFAAMGGLLALALYRAGQMPWTR
jgi:lycopene beta-cyclase